MHGGRNDFAFKTVIINVKRFTLETNGGTQDCFLIWVVTGCKAERHAVFVWVGTAANKCSIRVAHNVLVWCDVPR
jgi:hypothetical protein